MISVFSWCRLQRCWFPVYSHVRKNVEICYFTHNFSLNFFLLRWRVLAFSERDKLNCELEESRRICGKLTEERENLIKQLEEAVKVCRANVLFAV